MSSAVSSAQAPYAAGVGRPSSLLLESSSVTVPSSATETMAPGIQAAASEVVPQSAQALEISSGGASGGALVVDDPEVPEEEDLLQPWLEQVSILSHLAFFAQLGVVIRMGLEVLFGPTLASVTSDSSSLFLDVPANMVGSFIMGIVGFTSKKHIAEFSQPLAIGLSTGLCGSITTYASWNQRVIAIVTQGLVVRGLFAYVLGTAVAYYSFIVGIDSAEGLKNSLHRYNQKLMSAQKAPLAVRPEHYKRRWASLVTFVALAVVFWAVSGVVLALDTSATLRKAALACLMGPFGCWVRWWLSNLNGGGVGRKQHLKWLPVGTLSTNLLAVVLEASLSTVDAIHNDPTGSLIVGGLQSGLMGCMSTVSTLMQEVHILRTAKASHGRSYAYLYLFTFGSSIFFGILLYSVPVWIHGAAYNGYNKV